MRHTSRFLRGGRLIGHSTGGSTIVEALLNVYPTAIVFHFTYFFIRGLLKYRLHDREDFFYAFSNVDPTAHILTPYLNIYLITCFYAGVD